MREILFIGKRKDNGEWVEGVYYKQTIYYGDPCEKHFIITSTESLCYDQAFEYYEVDPKTICQFTDLMDKNENYVFDGDILKFTDTNAGYEWIGKVEFGNPNAEYNWGFQLVYISGTKANTDTLMWFDMEESGAFCEVIGNIHDNPELLETDFYVGGKLWTKR